MINVVWILFFSTFFPNCLKMKENGPKLTYLKTLEIACCCHPTHAELKIILVGQINVEWQKKRFQNLRRYLRIITIIIIIVIGICVDKRIARKRQTKSFIFLPSRFLTLGRLNVKAKVMTNSIYIISIPSCIEYLWFFIFHSEWNMILLSVFLLWKATVVMAAGFNDSWRIYLFPHRNSQ